MVVSAWLTTPDQAQLLTRQPDIAWTRNGKTSGSTIFVDERQSYQQMVGFGASFTDSSAWLMQQKLALKERSDLMKKLFHPRAGIGLSFLRQPLGASDLTTCGNYSYDEMPAGQTDPTLANFSIGHDRASILPLLKQALHINPRLRIMATPWSPPGWMKSSDSMIGGTLNASAYEPYATYLVKCIQAYAVEDVPLPDARRLTRSDQSALDAGADQKPDVHTGELQPVRLHLPEPPMRDGRFFVDVTVVSHESDRELALADNSLELTVFALAVFVGYHVVWRVTPALHSPLMSVTNAISSVIIVGALIAAGPLGVSFAKVMGFVAVTLAAVNIFGGFIVTQRMLQMFRKKR